MEVGPSRKLHLGSDFRFRRLDEGGNIAAGKSTVVDLFRKWGATIIDADALVREHVLVSGPRRAEHERAEGEVIEVRQAERQTTRLLRGHATPSDDGTEVRPATLEEIVVGYLRSEREEVPQ